MVGYIGRIFLLWYILSLKGNLVPGIYIPGIFLCVTAIGQNEISKNSVLVGMPNFHWSVLGSFPSWGSPSASEIYARSPMVARVLREHQHGNQNRRWCVNMGEITWFLGLVGCECYGLQWRRAMRLLERSPTRCFRSHDLWLLFIVCAPRGSSENRFGNFVPRGRVFMLCVAYGTGTEKCDVSVECRNFRWDTYVQ